MGRSDFYEHLLGDADENLYFGKGEVNKHVLVKNWKNKGCFVNFKVFKNTYLPLGSVPMDENWDGIYKYYRSISGEMIYKLDNVNFLIPFEEFLKKALNMNFIENLKASILHRKFIFTLTATIHRLKENIYTKYKVEISMENFEIKFEVTHED